MQGHRSALVIIDQEPGCSRELIQKALQVLHVLDFPTQQKKGVVGILEDGARRRMVKRVADGGVLLDESLQNIGHKQEQVRRHRVPLTQPTFASDPWSRTTIDKHSSA